MMLEKLFSNLKENISKNEYIKIPNLWNYYIDKSVINNSDIELEVNPYGFFSNLIMNYYLKRESSFVLKENWINSASIYSVMIRHLTAYGNETGSFLRTLAVLPYLYDMGIDTIYLLPIFKYSKKNKKGELGSPYAVSNFFIIEDSLKDKYSNLSAEDEFKCFVEACHLLNMKVIIDIIPRTCAIDNDYIEKHKDWFYWINKDSLYEVPYVKELAEQVPPTKENMEIVYKDKKIINFINSFKYHNEENIIVANAFSDWINDPQPTWDDITYFRMYLDQPIDNIAPYILFDTIKCNLYPQKNINKELWDLITNIIPYYQESFNIDGTRIDMGHALPIDLTKSIIKKARDINKNFCFIAEELDPNNSDVYKELGYNAVVGNGFYQEGRFDGPLKWFIENSKEYSLPIFACGETHDTPRLVNRDGGKKYSLMVSLLNYFLPNGINFINSGQEFYEEKPMNTGLDFSKDSKIDIKNLALFSNVIMNHTNKDNMINDLIIVNNIKNKYLLDNNCNNKTINFIEGEPIYFYYSFELYDLIILANPFINKAMNVKLDIPYKLMKGTMLYSTNEEKEREFNEFDEFNRPYFFLGPNEFKITILKKIEISD